MSLPTCPTCKYAQHICGKTGVTIRHSTGCTYHTPDQQKHTRADQLRAMTDEELAEWINDTTGACPEKTSLKYCINQDCHQCLLEWLRQEATE